MRFLAFLALAAFVGSIAGVVLLALGLVDLRKQRKDR